MYSSCVLPQCLSMFETVEGYIPYSRTHRQDITTTPQTFIEYLPLSGSCVVCCGGATLPPCWSHSHSRRSWVRQAVSQ